MGPPRRLRKQGPNECLCRKTLTSHEFGNYVIEIKWEEMSDMWAKLEEELDIN